MLAVWAEENKKIFPHSQPQSSSGLSQYLNQCEWPLCYHCVHKKSGLKRFKLAKKAFKVLHTADEENQLLWVKGLSLMFGDRTTLKASEMECYVAAGLIPCLVKLCISPFPYIPYYALNTLVSLSTLEEYSIKVIEQEGIEKLILLLLRTTPTVVYLALTLLMFLTSTLPYHLTFKLRTSTLLRGIILTYKYWSEERVEQSLVSGDTAYQQQLILPPDCCITISEYSPRYHRMIQERIFLAIEGMFKPLFDNKGEIVKILKDMPKEIQSSLVEMITWGLVYDQTTCKYYPESYLRSSASTLFAAFLSPSPFLTLPLYYHSHSQSNQSATATSTPSPSAPTPIPTPLISDNHVLCSLSNISHADYPSHYILSLFHLSPQIQRTATTTNDTTTATTTTTTANNNDNNEGEDEEDKRMQRVMMEVLDMRLQMIERELGVGEGEEEGGVGGVGGRYIQMYKVRIFQCRYRFDTLNDSNIDELISRVINDGHIHFIHALSSLTYYTYYYYSSSSPSPLSPPSRLESLYTMIGHYIRNIIRGYAHQCTTSLRILQNKYATHLQHKQRTHIHRHYDGDDDDDEDEVEGAVPLSIYDDSYDEPGNYLVGIGNRSYFLPKMWSTPLLLSAHLLLSRLLSSSSSFSSSNYHPNSPSTRGGEEGEHQLKLSGRREEERERGRESGYSYSFLSGDYYTFIPRNYSNSPHQSPEYREYDLTSTITTTTTTTTTSSREEGERGISHIRAYTYIGDDDANHFSQLLSQSYHHSLHYYHQFIDQLQEEDEEEDLGVGGAGGDIHYIRLQSSLIYYFLCLHWSFLTLQMISSLQWLSPSSSSSNNNNSNNDNKRGDIWRKSLVMVMIKTFDLRAKICSLFLHSYQIIQSQSRYFLLPLSSFSSTDDDDDDDDDDDIHVQEKYHRAEEMIKREEKLAKLCVYHLASSSSPQFDDDDQREIEEILKHLSFSEQEMNNLKDLDYSYLYYSFPMLLCDVKIGEKVEEEVQPLLLNDDSKICLNCLCTGEKFKVCSRCKSVRYCSKECQVADWPLHKPFCKPKK